MKFRLIDEIIERTESSIIAVKTVTVAEEYLRDHFPAWPVLPGVLMVETLVQAGRELLAERSGDRRLVLGEAKAIRYGRFVKPGETLRVEVELLGETGDGGWRLKGSGYVIRPGEADPGPDNGAENAVTGRFVLRPLRRVKDARPHETV